MRPRWPSLDYTALKQRREPTIWRSKRKSGLEIPPAYRPWRLNNLSLEQHGIVTRLLKKKKKGKDEFDLEKPLSFRANKSRRVYCRCRRTTPIIRDVTCEVAIREFRDDDVVFPFQTCVTKNMCARDE